MSRTRRILPDGYAFHVINRGVNRQTIFPERSDCEHFLAFMAATAERVRMRVVSVMLMGNHFHLVLWPHQGIAVSEYMQLLTGGYSCHHHAVHGRKGSGHLFQGRFKSFIIQNDVHLLNVLRYVEANPVRARCVKSGDEWPWSSIGRDFVARYGTLLSPSPVPRPANWLTYVNRAIPPEDLVALRISAHRERPYGDRNWLSMMVRTYGLEHTIREPGRPGREAAFALIA